MKTCSIKVRVWGAILAIIIFTVFYFFFLPVKVTLYKNVNSGTLQPFGPIMPGHRLEQCLDGNFSNIDSIEIFSATYRRQNSSTNLFTLYALDRGQKQELVSRNFNSAGVPDNQYFTLNFAPVTSGGNLQYPADAKTCFSISSADGSANNAVTVWLNKFNDPVFRLKTTLPFYRALDYIQGGSWAGLPYWMLYLLGFIFIGANLGVLALLIIKGINEYQKTK